MMFVQLSKESSSKTEELRERYAEALKKKDQAEAAKKKAEMELQKLRVNSYIIIALMHFCWNFRL